MQIFRLLIRPTTLSVCACVFLTSPNKHVLLERSNVFNIRRLQTNMYYWNVQTCSISDVAKQTCTTATFKRVQYLTSPNKHVLLERSNVFNIRCSKQTNCLRNCWHLVVVVLCSRVHSNTSTTDLFTSPTHFVVVVCSRVDSNTRTTELFTLPINFVAVFLQVDSNSSTTELFTLLTHLVVVCLHFDSNSSTTELFTLLTHLCCVDYCRYTHVEYRMHNFVYLKLLVIFIC